jgi:hypothetical protein
MWALANISTGQSSIEFWLIVGDTDSDYADTSWNSWSIFFNALGHERRTGKAWTFCGAWGGEVSSWGIETKEC